MKYRVCRDLLIDPDRDYYKSDFDEMTFVRRTAKRFVDIVTQIESVSGDRQTDRKPLAQCERQRGRNRQIEREIELSYHYNCA